MLRTYAALCTLFVLTTATTAPAYGQGFFRDLFDPNCDGVQATFGQEYLFATRDTRIDTGGNVVNGADAGRLGFDHSDFGYESGYRFTLGVQNRENRIEAIFADYGTWFSQGQASLTSGLSFDGGVPASWPAGASTLGTTTFFTPLHFAATAALGGEGDEHEGLGPNNAFGDAIPTMRRHYQSELQDVQINWLNNDPSADLRVGLGYRNVQLDETASLEISGIFRATDVGAPNGGLSHATLTGVAGLTYSTNVPNGFEDESILGNNGTPDQLVMQYGATTTNDLNGFQVVVNACMINYDWLEVSLTGRAGAYHNQAKGFVSERFIGTEAGGDRSVYGRTFRDSKDSVAFVGGVGVNSSLKLTDHWRLFGTYSGTFIGGVALSPEQVAGIRGGAYQVNTDGHLIVHGGTVGLELIY